jgi:hypothetical protein
VAAPGGWVVDDRPGVEDGIPLVLFPAGGSFQQSPAVMYVRTFARNSGRTLTAFVRDDVAQQRSRSKHCRVGERPAIALGSGVRAWLRDFTNDRWGNCETVAYLEGEEGFVTVVLSARDEKSRAAAGDAIRRGAPQPAHRGRGPHAAGGGRRLPRGPAERRHRQAPAFETRVTETLGKAQCDAMRDCAGPATGGEREVFDLLLRLGSDGKVEQVLARPETRAATVCGPRSRARSWWRRRSQLLGEGHALVVQARRAAGGGRVQLSQASGTPVGPGLDSLDVLVPDLAAALEGEQIVGDHRPRLGARPRGSPGSRPRRWWSSRAAPNRIREGSRCAAAQWMPLCSSTAAEQRSGRGIGDLVHHLGLTGRSGGSALSTTRQRGQATTAGS